MEYATFALVKEEGDALEATAQASYEQDVHAWAMWQAELIRRGRFDELDIENLADEVEDVARRERKDLESRLSLVFHHILKWDHQPDRRSASWARTIQEQRRQVIKLLNESPSLKPRLNLVLEEAHRQGRVAMLNQTRLGDGTVSETNHYSWDDLMARPIVWSAS